MDPGPLQLGFSELKSLEEILSPRLEEKLKAALVVKPQRTPAAAAAPSAAAAAVTRRVGAPKPDAGAGAPAPAADGGPPKLPHTMVRFRLLSAMRDRCYDNVRLNNNGITELLPLYRVMTAVLASPSQLVWIDLSCNGITSIGPAFAKLPALKRLYLHSNALTSLADLEELQGNREMTVLTLYANPVQDKKNYRLYTVSSLPWLKSLDSSSVTRRELEAAISWRKMTKFVTRTAVVEED